MDPNETLEQIRGLIEKSNTEGLTMMESGALCELIEELDEWLSRGGFLPAAWGAETR